MPTYDYVCDACKHAFELFQAMKDDPQKKCPKCGKLKLRRLIGAGAAVVFKGSGFYQTDYRSDSYKKRAEADSKAASGGGESKSSGEGKSSGESKSSGEGKSKGDAGGAKGAPGKKES